MTYPVTAEQGFIIFVNPFSAEPGYILPLQKSVDPDLLADLLASQEANRSGSALFTIKYVNL